APATPGVAHAPQGPPPGWAGAPPKQGGVPPPLPGFDREPERGSKRCRSPCQGSPRNGGGCGDEDKVSVEPPADRAGGSFLAGSRVVLLPHACGPLTFCCVIGGRCLRDHASYPRPS